ncbi:MAG TPA: hypothetical protein VHN14_22780, partial [Kofleriaceae bacterium]|nr:hypothetical protein [Kofleriaceae bacterium]
MNLAQGIYMASTRLLLAIACVLPIAAVACGGSGSDTPPVPEGTHYGYVVSKALVPASMDQARMYGLDLGAAKSGTPDGTIDNQLGVVLSTLAGMGFAIQPTIDTAVNQGSIILLVDFQTKDFKNTSAAGLTVKIGATPMPAPCTDANDKVCGHHLTGSGSFSVAANSPVDAAVAGKIVNGTFNGGPGDLSLQIALGTTEPLTLSLLAARAKATAISDTGMTLTVGGLISTDDLNTQIFPALQVQLTAVLDNDCPPLAQRTGTNCGCKSTSTG